MVTGHDHHTHFTKHRFPLNPVSLLLSVSLSGPSASTAFSYSAASRVRFICSALFINASASSTLDDTCHRHRSHSHSSHAPRDARCRWRIA
eukprot:2554432-Prymnesium_polylepis.1